MTTDHTQGTIGYHENGDANSYALLDANGRWWLSALMNGEMLTERQRANMRRLAACWNACEGIPTERLEPASGETAPVFELLMKATEQRDEMLEALQSVMEWTADDSVPAERKLSLIRSAARAAIAKATGGEA